MLERFECLVSRVALVIVIRAYLQCHLLVEIKFGMWHRLLMVQLTAT